MAGQSISSRLTVLLPLEQEGWHQTISQLLEPQGVQTVLVRSGQEALELIRQRPVHAAVLDAQMPRLGGMQVVRLMHQLESAPPAILLTSDLSVHMLREALEMQVFSVLSKPVDLNMLLDALARLLRRYYENRWPGDEERNEPNRRA